MGMISYDVNTQREFSNTYQPTIGEPQFILTLEGSKSTSNNLI